MQRIDNFKWEIEQQGPLAMPEIETKIKQFQNKAWQMQRLLDRLAADRMNHGIKITQQQKIIWMHLLIGLQLNNRI